MGNYLVYKGYYGGPSARCAAYYDGTYAYSINADALTAYAYTTEGLFVLNTIVIPSIYADEIAFLSGDGTYIYVGYHENGTNDGYVRAYTFDGISFTQVGVQLIAGFYVYNGYCSSGSIYITTIDMSWPPQYRMYRYTFNGSVFTQEAVIADGVQGIASEMVRIGNTLYTIPLLSAASISAYNALTLAFIANQGITSPYTMVSLCAIGPYIIAATAEVLLRSLTFNGSTFSTINSIVPTHYVYNLFSDGNYVYTANYGPPGEEVGMQYSVDGAGVFSKIRDFILPYIPPGTASTAVWANSNIALFGNVRNLSGYSLVAFGNNSTSDQCPIGSKYQYIPFNRTYAPLDYSPGWSLTGNDPAVTTSYLATGLNAAGPGKDHYDTFSTGITIDTSNDYTFEVFIKSMPDGTHLNLYAADAAYPMFIITRASAVSLFNIQAYNDTAVDLVSSTNFKITVQKYGASSYRLLINDAIVKTGSILFSAIWASGLKAINMNFGDQVSSGGTWPYTDFLLSYLYCINSNMPQTCLGPGVVSSFTYAYDPVTGKAPNTVTFTDISTGTPTSWLWLFGDGASSTDQNPVHLYNNADTYTVTLTVENAISTDTTTDTFDVHFDMIFDAVPLTTTPLIPITFNNTTVGNPLYWLWDFGDGSTGSDQNPVHAYTGIGTYDVTLYAGATGLVEAYPRLGYISIVSALNADFLATPTSGYSPLTVSFTDLSVGSPISWLWDFGDSTSSTDQNPVHVYALPGTYTVILTVSDGVDTSIETKVDYIASKITIDATPRFGIVPLEVLFSTIYAGLSYLWDFGDGTTSTSVSPKHTYTTVGNHTITLRVMNSIGQWVPAYEPNFISVSKLDFGVNPDEGKLPVSVQFLNKSSTPTGCEFSNFYWGYGDGVTGSVDVHTYTGMGEYIPALYATLIKL